MEGIRTSPHVHRPHIHFYVHVQHRAAKHTPRRSFVLGYHNRVEMVAPVLVRFAENGDTFVVLKRRLPTLINGPDPTGTCAKRFSRKTDTSERDAGSVVLGRNANVGHIQHSREVFAVVRHFERTDFGVRRSHETHLFSPARIVRVFQPSVFSTFIFI